MSYNFSIETTSGKRADQVSSEQNQISSRKGWDYAAFTEGQKVTGTVVAVDEQVTLNFNGMEATASKNVLKDSKLGDVKSFEVVKANDNEIELRLIDKDSNITNKTFTAVKVKDNDWESILAKKEQSVKRSEQETEYKDIQDKLNKIASTLTELDYKKLEAEGFPVESFTVSGLAEALNRVKTSGASNETNEGRIVDKASKGEGKTAINITTKATSKGEPKDEINAVTKEAAEGDVTKADTKTDRSADIKADTKTGTNASTTASSSTVTKSIQQSKQVTTTIDKKSLAKLLEEENLPVTEDNINKLSNALALSGLIPNMDDKTMQKLIATNSEPTVENIYKAYYSGTTQKTDKLTDTAWNQLKNQVTDVIKSAGYEVNEENLADARWLIENNLPLTKETFAYKKDLENIRSNYDQKGTLDQMLTGMKEGFNPKDVSLIPIDNTKSERLISEINSISDEAVALAVKDNSEITLHKLVTIQESLAAGSGSENTGRIAEKGSVTNKETVIPDKDSVTTNADTAEAVKNAVNNQSGAGSKHEGEAESSNSKEFTEEQYKEIKARRQLEEIRLKMTVESAGKLEKQGFSVDTEELSRVVEELRSLEDNYYKNLLREADVNASEQSVQSLKDTVQGIDQLKYMPCSLLGSTLELRSSQTITGLLEEGNRLSAEYAKAGTAYETMATIPIGEYGDSIKKAFQNAESLLAQMNLENTEDNRRAVRILGYNQMEITQDSINQVKAYDKQVSTLMQNLHPAVAVRMIKEGMNPLEMPINELNKTIDNIKEEQGITSEDKYSTYLRNLEKQQGISEEERKAYIGIYRLLYNVDKSDGAALGAVIKADREVTMSNLLTAIQTSKKGSIDSIVNDEFGELQNVSYQGESIAQQLGSLTGSAGQQNSGNASMEGSAGEQIEYLDRIIKQIMDEITPEKLNEAGNNLNEASGNQTSGAFVHSSRASAVLASSDKSIWEKLNGVPVDKLLEKLNNMEDTQTTKDTEYTAKVQELRELCRNSEQSIRFLNDYRMPSTSLNIVMAQSILSNGESPVKKLLKLNNENQEVNSENNLKEINDLSDKLIDKSSMQDAYEQLEVNAKDTLKKACAGEVIDSRRLAELKTISGQMTFHRALAEREFYQIPIETEKGITNMNLTILRGTETSGKVSVNVHSETLGNINAEFSIKDQVLKGYFGSDNTEGLELIKKNTSGIEAAAQDSNITIKQLDFGIRSRENDNYSYQNPKLEAESNTVADNTEKTLYRIAKAVVQTVRMAENNSTNYERAVS